MNLNKNMLNNINMIIPIRCVTCGKVLADKWKYYSRKCREQDEIADKNKKDRQLQGNTSQNEDPDLKYFENTDRLRGKILDSLNLTRICCRRMMLTHVDIIENL